MARFRTVRAAARSRVAKIGSGTLTLTGPNAFSGDTTIGGGTLSFDTGTLDSTASIVFEGGSLQWYGSNKAGDFCADCSD